MAEHGIRIARFDDPLILARNGRVAAGRMPSPAASVSRVAGEKKIVAGSAASSDCGVNQRPFRRAADASFILNEWAKSTNGGDGDNK